MQTPERHSPERASLETRNAGVRRVLWLTLGLNLLVAVLKLIYGSLTHTLSLRADGFHSLTDGSNTVLGLLGMWWAARPPDSKHPYGHEKVEVLAASAIGASLLLVAWNVVSGAIERLQHGAEAPELNLETWAVMLLGWRGCQSTGNAPRRGHGRPRALSRRARCGHY